MSDTVRWMDALRMRANNHYRAGRWATAIAYGRRTLRHLDCLNETVAVELCGLVVDACRHLGKWRLARRMIRIVLIAYPEAAELYHLLGRLYEDDPVEGSTRQAAAAHRRAARLCPCNARYQHALGRTLFAAGATRQGLHALETAVRRDGQSLEYWESWTQSLLAAGQRQRAERVLARARFLIRPSSTYKQLSQRLRFAAAKRLQVERDCRRLDRPALLPFISQVPMRDGARVASSTDGWILRMDAPSANRPPSPQTTRLGRSRR